MPMQPPFLTCSMQICMIVAAAKNGTIGKDNTMPWHLPADLARFKRITMGHHIIMGRKTFDALGRALPGRPNLVITRNTNLELPEGATAFNSLDNALGQARAAGETTAFIIGGAEIFAMAMPVAHKLYLTAIDAEFEGDTFFEVPDFMVEETRSCHEADEKNPYPYCFIDYVKA